MAKTIYKNTKTILKKCKSHIKQDGKNHIKQIANTTNAKTTLKNGKNNILKNDKNHSKMTKTTFKNGKNHFKK